MSSCPKDLFLSPLAERLAEEGSSLVDNKPFFIGVAGGTASGKTTVCDAIIQHLDRRVTLISQDSFYKPLTEEQRADVASYNFDHPDAFDHDLIVQTLAALRARKCVEIPIYDFVTHSRSSESRLCFPCDVIIFEGIMALYHSAVREMFDMKIFVDTDDDLRLARRIKRDIAERGRNLLSVLEQYERTVKPSYDEFVNPTKRFADIIIPRGGENYVAIDLIVKHIQVHLERTSKGSNKFF